VSCVCIGSFSNNVTTRTKGLCFFRATARATYLSGRESNICERLNSPQVVRFRLGRCICLYRSSELYFLTKNDLASFGVFTHLSLLAKHHVICLPLRIVLSTRKHERAHLDKLGSIAIRICCAYASNLVTSSEHLIASMYLHGADFKPLVV